MWRTAPLLMLAALMAACGDSAADLAENSNTPRIKMKNEHHEALERLSPDLQRIGLMRAIRQTGNRCQRVDNVGYQQEYRDMRMWVAQCGPQPKNWAIFIAPNGDVQVRDCAQAGQLSLPRCEPPPPTPTTGGNVFREGASDNAFRSRLPQ